MKSEENICECFACNIPNLDTIKLKKYNGVFPSEGNLALNCISGEINIKNEKDNHSVIAIKDNVRIERPLQIINLLDDNTSEVEDEISICVGTGSEITVIYCDDTLPKTQTKSHHKISIDLKPYSRLSLYKMENVNNSTSIHSDLTFDLQSDAQLNTFFITLNGGHLINNVRVNFNGDRSFADLNGLYLMDRQQSVETLVDVFHYKNSCKSTQLFKGILDDEAQAKFLGHVLVDYDAERNIAHQTNNNILLTDKAKMSTRPVLEIYNDDVQCSHGATTGQLDEEALYYLRSRGISERQAKMLLMNAFCQSVLHKSNIAELRDGLGNLIQKRLEGGLSMENPFKIDIL